MFPYGRRDACPTCCGFMVLCPFGGFFLPLVHRGSVLGFRPYGFLAGPIWFHGLVEVGFMAWTQTPARISAPACTGGFEPRTEDGCFHVHGVCSMEILIEMRLGESGVTQRIVCGIVNAGRWCHPAHRTQGTEARAPCVTRLQQPRVRGRPVYGLFRVHVIGIC